MLSQTTRAIEAYTKDKLHNVNGILENKGTLFKGESIAGGVPSTAAQPTKVTAIYHKCLL